MFRLCSISNPFLTSVRKCMLFITVKVRSEELDVRRINEKLCFCIQTFSQQAALLYTLTVAVETRFKFYLS